MTSTEIKEIINLIQNNNTKLAGVKIKDLIKVNSNNEILYNLSGILNIKKDNYDNAINDFKKAIDINPKFSSAYTNLGAAYEKLNDYSRSAENLTIACNLDPNSDIIYNNLGNVLGKQKKFEEAIINIKKAIAINANNFKACFDLGNIYSDLEKFDDAIKYYKQALEINGKFSEAYFNLGESYRKLNKFKEALKSYELSKNEKTDVRILECYLALNQKEKYVEKINVYSEIDPDNRRIAAISAYISNQFNINNGYPFCPDPLEFIYKTTLKKHFKDLNGYINELYEEITSQNFKWEPSGKTTVKGFGTVGNLSDKKLPNLILLEKAINKELNSYFLNFKKKQIKFIQNWPKNFKIVSWSNRLKKEGHNIPHIHPSGWVSGVCYLKVPKKIKNDEAGIEFSLHGDDYKIINNNVPKKSIQPEIGDIVLFPSSLFHRTIPFSSDEERVCIAFDLCREA